MLSWGIEMTTGFYYIYMEFFSVSCLYSVVTSVLILEISVCVFACLFGDHRLG